MAAHPDPTHFPSPADALDLRRAQASVAARTASLAMGPWMRQMDLGSLSRSFPACVPRGRDRPRPGPASQEAGLERLACLPPRCPPGSAPPGLALADTSQGAWSQDTWGTRPRAAAARPSPNPCWGVYLRRSSSLFSLSLFFSLGVGTPWVPGAQGNPSLFVCGRRGPTPGSRVTAPAPLHCLPPLTLQPGVDGGTELGFSASGGEVLVAGKGKGIFPESLRLGPLPELAGPTRLPADQLPAGPPRPLNGGNT